MFPVDVGVGPPGWQLLPSREGDMASECSAVEGWMLNRGSAGRSHSRTGSWCCIPWRPRRGC